MFVGFIFLFMVNLFTRTIGEYTTGRKGPLLFIIGGIHGNEPSGVIALQKVIKSLHAETPLDFQGKVVAVHGNIPALKQRKRYVDCDLNRMWSKEEIQRVKRLAPAARNTEERELLELLSHIETEFEKEYTDIVLLDLHTTSGPMGLFSIITNEKGNQELASALHAPVLFDLAHELSTNTNRFMDENNIKGIAFEAGQHDEAASILNQEAAIWLTLDKMGMINSEERTFDMDPHHAQLITAARHLPHFVRVIYRHAITPADQFHMYPGYNNFHEVYKGEPIAHDANGEVLCPFSGLMLMPLYQSQGNDGFFIMEKLYESPI